MYKSAVKSFLLVTVFSLILISLPSAFADSGKESAKITGSSVVFTLMEKKRAFVSDLIDILMIYKNKSIDNLSFDEKINILRDMKIISSKTVVDVEKPLTKGFAALLFHAALELKGGLTIKLTGRSQRNCLQDMIFLKIMSDSAAADKLSGPELVSLLQRAKEYKISETRGFLQEESLKEDAVETTKTPEKKSAVNDETVKAGPAERASKSDDIKSGSSLASGKKRSGASEKTGVSRFDSSAKNENENMRSGEGIIPRSSDISNLMSSSNDMSYLVPRDLASRWGFVFAYNYYKFIDEDKNAGMPDSPTGAEAPDLRFWLSKRLENNDSYYVRARYGRLNLKGDNNLAPPDSKNIGLKFDMIYYTFNRKADTSVKIGRQFFRIGRGFTYAGIHDGLHIEKLYPNWILSGFVSRTQPRESNSDQSNAGYLNRSYRDFYGIQADYIGLKNKKIYGYALAERDGQVKIPYTPKEFTYDANYVGAGIEGSIKPNWPYYFEYVLQNGKTAASNTITGTDSIKANAYYLGTDYYFTNNKCRPFLTLEYAHASGDPDRASVTDVIGGNRAGTDDKNFMPYGVYDLGLALHPRFSNINVFKFGGFIKPFYRSQYFKEMQLGAKYMIYHKDDANGAISDTFATVANKKIGSGYDLYLTWRPFSDTLIYFNYGVFSPGDAYPAGRRDKSKLINIGTTLFF